MPKQACCPMCGAQACEAQERVCRTCASIVLGGPECREEKVWRCSECEEVLSWDYEGYDPETDGPAYCEHCGSKVTGPKVVS